MNSLHRHHLAHRLAAALALLWLLAAALAADAPATPTLNPAQAKLLAAMQATVPPGYRVEPQVEMLYSDDAQGLVPRLISLTPRNPAGQEDGVVLYYGDTGAVERQVPFVNGVKHGVELESYLMPDPETKKMVERVVTEIPWDQGKVVGVKKLYHRENGKLRQEVPYVAGLQEGEAREYDLPGRLQKRSHYQAGKLHGELTEYYPASGHPRRVIPYVHGVVEGLMKEYYDNGKLKRELPLLAGKFHGAERLHAEDGTHTSSRFWLADERVAQSDYEAATAKRPER